MDLLRLIAGGELCVNDLVIKLKLSQPKVSMLLKDLRDYKLIISRIDGKKRYYSVDRLVLNNYVSDIKKMLSDFEDKSSNEIIVRRKA